MASTAEAKHARHSQELDKPVAGETPHTRSVLRDAADTVMFTGAIYVCYLLYGIVQESIYKEPRGPEKEKFHYSLTLVWFQCVANGVLGWILTKVFKQPKAIVPKMEYAKIAFSYIGAMFASNLALSYVSYPTQALGKSCKLIPVMLMRIIINRQKYKLHEYLNVALITAGIYVFMWTADSKKAAHDEKSTTLWGMVLLMISLALDGFTGPSQERVTKTYKSSTHQMMFAINFWAGIFVSIALLMPFTEQLEGFNFILRHPSILKEIAVFSVCSAVGQWVILECLFHFNSLTLTIITTTRKFFTILASVLWYGHSLNLSQWSGVGMVFLSLSLDIYWKHSGKKHGHSHHKK